MDSFKNSHIGSFVESFKLGHTELGCSFRYSLLCSSASTSQKIKKIAFFLTDEQSQYDREILHDQLIHYERILSLKNFGVEYSIYEIGTELVFASEIVMAALIKNTFDLVVPIGDYPTDVVSIICQATGLDPKINFVNVENPIRTRMVGISGEPLPNRTGVVRIPPSYERQISFLRKYNPTMKNVLMLRDDHYIIVPAYECESLNQALVRHGCDVESMVIMSKMDVTAQLTRRLPDYDAVIIDHGATIARTHILEIVRLCNMIGIPVIASDATSVHMGAAIGFGHNGFPYGRVAVPLGAQLLLSEEENKKILVRELYEDENLVFNEATRRLQGIQVDISMDAALYAKSVTDKYAEHGNSPEREASKDFLR